MRLANQVNGRRRKKKPTRAQHLHAVLRYQREPVAPRICAGCKAPMEDAGIFCAPCLHPTAA